jgi:hypothetical protein
MFRRFDPLQEFALANAAHRHTDHDLPSPSGTLLVTSDGIFLWPGSPLLTKLEGRFVVRRRDRVYDLVCRLHGPRAAWTPLLPVLERAAQWLNDGDVEAGRACLDRIVLPPLTRAGADLVCAIASRLDVEPPAVPVTSNDGTGLCPGLAAGLASAYDTSVPGLWPLCKVAAGSDFDRTHPRLGERPNAGWFVTPASDGGTTLSDRRASSSTRPRSGPQFL